jgi:hypothetical protein
MGITKRLYQVAMNQCNHPNCKQGKVENGLCEYHLEEYNNNGKPGHWTCTWCTEYKQETETHSRSMFD